MNFVSQVTTQPLCPGNCINCMCFRLQKLYRYFFDLDFISTIIDTSNMWIDSRRKFFSDFNSWENKTIIAHFPYSCTYHFMTFMYYFEVATFFASATIRWLVVITPITQLCMNLACEKKWIPFSSLSYHEALFWLYRRWRERGLCGWWQEEITQRGHFRVHSV